MRSTTTHGSSWRPATYSSYSLQLPCLGLLASPGFCQNFGGVQELTGAAVDARSAYATDLDGDGDADFLSASSGDKEIAWYENLGGGLFGEQQIIAKKASLAAAGSFLALFLSLAPAALVEGGGQATGAGNAPPWQATHSPAPGFEVNLATGNVLFSFRTSCFLHGGLAPRHALDLYFNTQAKGKVGDYTGGFNFGNGWSSSFGSRLEFPTETSALLTREDGDEVAFTLQGNDWVPEFGSLLELESRASEWVVRDTRQWEYGFNAGGDLTRISSASGNNYVIQRASGRVVQGTEPSGRFVTLQYDVADKLEKATDSFGAEWTFSYDSLGRLDQIGDPEYGPVLLTYDTRGRIASYTDYEGHQWTFGYFDQDQFTNRVKRVTLVGGETVTVAYQDLATSVETRLTDARAGVWRYVHDKEDSPALVSITTPMGHTWSYAHNAKRQRTGMTSPLDKTWSYVYDAQGNLTQLTDPLARFTQFTYDTLGNPTEVSAGGTTYEQKFEDSEHPTSSTEFTEPQDSAGNTATQVFGYYGTLDGNQPGEWNGLLASSTDDTGGQARKNYDEYARTIAVQEGPDTAEGRIEARYDLSTAPTYVDHGGMNYPASFPALPPAPPQLQGRLSRSATGPAVINWRGDLEIGEVSVYVPIDSGDGVELSTARQEATYDARGRLVSLVETTAEPLFHVVSPPATTPSRAFTVTYGLDRIDAITPDGDVVSTFFDADQRVSRVCTNGGGAGEVDISYTYYADGAVQAVLRGDATSSHYTYAANGLVRTIDHHSDSASVLLLEYDYDDRNIPIGVTETRPGETVLRSYVYDLRRRLLRETRTIEGTPNSERWDYTYDAVGNRLTHERRIDGSLVESATYHYDGDDPALYRCDNDRLTWIEYEDGSSIPASTTWIFYENPYGNASHIVSRDAGSSSYLATVLKYTETGLPWLIWSETWDDLGNGPVNVARGDVIETRQHGSLSYLWRARSGQTFAPLGDAEWITALGGVQASYRVSSANGSTTSSELALLGSARLDAQGVESDGHDLVGAVRVRLRDGAVESGSEYSAFGSLLTQGPSLEEGGFAGRFGARQAFEGSAFAQHGLVKMGFRFFSPEFGRFVMRDPIGIGGGPNVYAFARNLPTALIDPSGLSREGPPGQPGLLPGGDSPSAAPQSGEVYGPPPPPPGENRPPFIGPRMPPGYLGGWTAKYGDVYGPPPPPPEEKDRPPFIGPKMPPGYLGGWRAKGPIIRIPGPIPLQ
jgi:RHS repeat-associated protein